MRRFWLTFGLICGVLLLGNGDPGATPILDGSRTGIVVQGKGDGCRRGSETEVSFFCVTHGKTSERGGGILFTNRNVPSYTNNVNFTPAAALGMTTAWVCNTADWAVEGSAGDHIHHIVDDLGAFLTAAAMAGVGRPRPE